MTRKKETALLLTLGLCLGPLAVAGAQAQDQRDASSLASKEAPLNRAEATAEVLSRWSGSTRDGGAELLAGLTNLSADGLTAARAAETPSALKAVFGGPRTNVLGDPSSDLVFFPLNPCRIIDTRSAAAGLIAANTSRGFDSQAPYTAQGGSATTCGIPGSDVPALVVTFVAVGPQGPGDLRIFPFNATPPNASAINYALPGQGLNIANTTVVPLLQDALETNEFTILADVSGTHVVADVVGYFAPATLVGTSSEGANSTQVAITATCANLTSCSVTNNSSVAVGVVVSGTVNAEVTHTTGALDVMVATLSDVNGTTCGTDEPDPGTVIYEIPAAYPTASLVDMTLSMTKRFSLAANTTETYFLNARMAFGDGGDGADSANIVCHVAR